MAVEIAKRLFTVHEYDRMAEAGILGEDDRVELIEGEIIAMPPIGPLHASVVDRFVAILPELIKGRAFLRVQNPLRLNDQSEHQPDVMLLWPRTDFYGDSHPTPRDVLLLVEVADASAAYDRQVKLPLYARAGIAEVWIVDLIARQVETYRTPEESDYRSQTTSAVDDELTVAAMPGVVLKVADLIG